MAENRRFYWMKLPNDYFRQLFQRKMRKQTGGIEMQLIYLKMLLYSIDKDAVIPFQGVYDSIEEELAEELGEESEMVKETINFLEANQRLERTENGIFLPEALKRVGSEGTSAERVRNFRRRKALQCNTNVTPVKQNCNGEKEIEIEIDNITCWKKLNSKMLSSLGQIFSQLVGKSLVEKAYTVLRTSFAHNPAKQRLNIILRMDTKMVGRFRRETRCYFILNSPGFCPSIGAQSK